VHVCDHDNRQPCDSSLVQCTGGVEGDEAEYAWLPIHCLKPFEPQDADKEENHSEDPNLSACIKAAEKVMTDLNSAKQSETHDCAAQGNADSDSDGGDCHTSLPLTHDAL